MSERSFCDDVLFKAGIFYGIEWADANDPYDGASYPTEEEQERLWKDYREKHTESEREP